MTDQEIIDKYLAFIEEGEREYDERQKDENTKKIVEAIRTATNGEFIHGPYSSTLMGSIDEYDEQGRILTADPNYKDSEINICGKTYPLTRVGWFAYIWLPDSKASYTTCWSEFRNKKLLSMVDLRPEYVKEYHKKKKEEVIDDNKTYKDKYSITTLGSGRKVIAKEHYCDGIKMSTRMIDIPFDCK